MAAIDDILGGDTPAAKQMQTATSLNPPRVQAPGTDASKVIGKPGELKQPTLKQPTEGAEKPPMTYVEMFQMLNPERPETAEEKAKRAKREKAEAVLSAVGDGISALSNLYFTSQYAPNAYDPSKSMSATTKERWDRMRQEREANRRAYADGYMRAKALDDANAKEDRNWRHTIEREKIADERYEVKAAQDKALADLNEKLKQHQITAAEYKAEQERIKAQFAEEKERLEQEYLNAGINQRKAAANASNASANASNAKADHYRNENGKGPTLQLEDDEPMHFGDDKDYDRTVMRLAPAYGVATEVTVVTEWGSKYNSQTKQRERVAKKQRTIARPVKDIAADIEREAAKRKEAKKQEGQKPEQKPEGKTTQGKGQSKWNNTSNIKW